MHLAIPRYVCPSVCPSPGCVAQLPRLQARTLAACSWPVTRDVRTGDPSAGGAYCLSAQGRYFVYFACAAVAVDSSHHHLLRGVDSVRLQMLSTGTCRQCGSLSVAGHNHRKLIGRDPIVKVSTTWVLTCLGKGSGMGGEVDIAWRDL